MFDDVEGRHDGGGDHRWLREEGGLMEAGDRQESL